MVCRCVCELSPQFGPTPRGSERICEQDAAQLPRWGGTRRDGWDGRVVVTCSFETHEVTRYGDRLAHNLEVAGLIAAGGPTDVVTQRCNRWNSCRRRYLCPTLGRTD